MKFTLKDYQEEAVGKVLENLKKASRRWHEEREKNAFSLSAATGAGKTVMAAAFFEALFHGDDSYDFEADPRATVIWFSDDPSLNEQTRFRLLEASDRLNFSDLVVVENTFNRDKFEAGKIYFLNTQKLGKKSLLVRGHDSSVEDDFQGELFPRIKPDLRSQTIWDTIQNTIDDPNLTLYLVLDEAHRGMGKLTENTVKEKSTIVKRLINGQSSISAIPIVVGISATVERFDTAMKVAESRTKLENVVVDSVKVQASGLLKDTIILDIPEKVGKFDTVLICRAVHKLKDVSEAWEEYGKLQKEDKIVKPLMVVQVPNTPDHDEIGQALDTILKEWEVLKNESIVHVFGEHTNIVFGNHSISYMSPERIQESQWVRVVLAKDAISTGWDCPRAEVMLSFRAATDRTHITQLLGRMIRSPLARRISGNDRLNSVECILPFFDSEAVEDVAEILMKGGDEESSGPLEGRRVLIHSKEVFPNSIISNDVWEKLTSLPSQSLPHRNTKPIKRLTALAQVLSSDGLLENAGREAHELLHKVLDSAKLRYSTELTSARQSVLTVEGKSLSVNIGEGEKTFNDFVEDADFLVIENCFKRSARIISPDLARTYAEYLASKSTSNESDEEKLIEAHVEIASMGLVNELQEYLEYEADKQARKWFDDYRVAIKMLPEEKQNTYKEIKAWSRIPQDIELSKPSSWIVATTLLNKDGSREPLPKYKNHLMIDKEGDFPADLNTWEVAVLEKESSRKDFICWYRNPSHPSHDSLGIPYENNGNYSMVRPDFIFFAKDKNGEIVVDVVDPHGIHFDDTLPKLDGLANYAQKHKHLFRRFESVAKIGDKFRVLDLMDETVSKEILKSEDPEKLFLSEIAFDYR